MQTTLFRRLALCALAAVHLGAMTSAATAGGGSFTRGCAARDLQILKMIEDRESTKAVAPERLNDALLAMLHARLVCHEGHVLDALEIYDQIIQSISTHPVLGRAPDFQ